MVRKNKFTAHYRELFGEPSTRTEASSSSVPSSSVPPEFVPDSQSSQRISPPVPRFDARAPPLMPPMPLPMPAQPDHIPHEAPPPMAAGIHPDLEVPPTAPFAM